MDAHINQRCSECGQNYGTRADDAQIAADTDEELVPFDTPVECEITWSCPICQTALDTTITVDPLQFDTGLSVPWTGTVESAATVVQVGPQIDTHVDGTQLRTDGRER